MATYEQPRRFVAAIRRLVACYVAGAGFFVVGVLVGGTP